MTKEEFAKLAMAMQTYYPRYNMLPNEQALNLWYFQLQDLDYKRAEAALNTWVATEKFPPYISDIRQMAAFVSGREEKPWDEAWHELQEAIRKFGMYQEAEATESMDEITRRCVKRLGFLNLCISQNPMQDRANFRDIYTAEAEREKQKSLIPEQLKQQICAIREQKCAEIEQKPS